ncbi:MAG TPA: TIGR00730 family Rossman fold protein [Steroidobacteraceae bacterium]|nr:TIGR00730 family Rossman fold protein [Steroidobacteraceae bacterium]
MSVQMMKQSRRTPLPWQTAKSAEDDPQAPQRLAAILGSPSYMPGDADPAFLQREDTRGQRLQLDYLKPELLLEAAGIRHTVVVFGSTRITEPAAAQRRLAAAHAAAARAPADAELRQRLAACERLVAMSHYYGIARELGRLVAQANPDPARCHTVVMTGGGPGIMEAANRGAFDAGSKTVGLNINLPHEQYPNPYVSPELCFRFHYFAIRKLHFLQRARALVAFPGGFGTLDEVFEALTLLQTGKMERVPVVLVGEQYWRRVIDLPFMIEEGVIDPEDAELFWFAEDAAAIWSSILAWYERSGGNPFRD